MRLPLSTRALGAIATTGAVTWVTAVAAFHTIRPDLPPGDAYISNYARGDGAAAMRAAFLVNGAGWIAAGLGLRRTLPAGDGPAWRSARTALTALTTAGGAATIVAGAFRADTLGSADHSTEAIIHARAAAVAFIALSTAGFVGWRAFRGTAAWHDWSRPALAHSVVACTLLATFAAASNAGADGFGWWQRGLAAVVIPGALGALGVRLMRTRGA